ncbi:MAG: CPBP family intramembrane metalloprotease [Candidatus Kerfeldbacteria bacterium]|nr:CPBP family intramembrane metalloprotease [Candidatus Kerfeldbacteria bacterium]
MSSVSRYNRVAEYLSLATLCASGVVLIALQLKLFGWLLLLAGAFLLLAASRDFAKNVLLIYVSTALLGLTPITTNISWSHMLFMGTMLALAIVIPYLVSRFVYRNHLVHFRFHHGRRWFQSEIYWILGTGLVAYVLIPYYLMNSAAYLNWAVEPGASNVLRLFVGTNSLGIWDELFFVSTVLIVLRRFFPFIIANLAQAVLFTSFLYELGFTGWGPLMIYPFALIQGFVFRKTQSLFYIITIHLTYDLVLFLALLNAHHPTWVPIFVT